MVGGWALGVLEWAELQPKEIIETAVCVCVCVGVYRLCRDQLLPWWAFPERWPPLPKQIFFLSSLTISFQENGLMKLILIVLNNQRTLGT